MPNPGLPNDPLTAIAATTNPNSDLPSEDFPSLGRIVVIDLVGPLAANKQHKALEKRDETMRAQINKLISLVNSIDNYYLRSDSSNPKTNIPGMLADLLLNAHKIINMAPGTAGTDGINKNQLDSAITALTNALNAEIATRTSADSTLTANLNSEISTRSAGDSALTSNLNSEIANRIAGDASLDGDKQDKLTANGTSYVDGGGDRVGASLSVVIGGITWYFPAHDAPGGPTCGCTCTCTGTCGCTCTGTRWN